MSEVDKVVTTLIESFNFLSGNGYEFEIVGIGQPVAKLIGHPTKRGYEKIFIDLKSPRALLGEE